MRISQRLCILVLCLSATALAHAQLPSAPEPQSDTGSINGTVTDINDDAVPHATVILDGATPADHRTALSDANGFFELNDLPAGTYRITLSSKGFADWTSAPIALKPGQDLDLPDVTLQLATAMSDVTVSYTQHQIATQQVHVEEEQRVLGIVPNFYVSYVWNAAPLSPGQKYQLAWRSIIDPVTFLGVGFFAGIEQADDAFPGYGQGAQGYGKRFGALFADGVTGTFIGGAILPTILHQDPRFYYKATGSIKSRILYAISTPFICKGDNGRWEPNYSSVIGDFAAGSISNIYYPAANRGVMLTIDNALLNTAGGSIGGLIQEFLIPKLTPIQEFLTRKLMPKANKQP